MKKPLMTIGVREITQEDYDHFFHKWLYQYGGAHDVVSLQEYIESYDSDTYGAIELYDTGLCPCIMCQENQYEQSGESPSEEMV